MRKHPSMHLLMRSLKPGESAIVWAESATSVSSVTSRAEGDFTQSAMLLVDPMNVTIEQVWLVTRKPTEASGVER